MLRLARWLIALALIAAAGAGSLYLIAGRGAAPSISIEQPDRAIGRAGTLVVVAGAPGARFSALTITLEQNGRAIPLFSLDSPQSAEMSEVDPDRLRVSRQIGRAQIPELQAGAARIVVSAARPSFLDLRTLSSTASKDIQVRLDPPRIAIVSTHHYVNHGGSEMVLYRTTPAEAWSGVRVGDLEYPGYAAAGAGVGNVDPSLKAAFFALLHDQDVATPIAVVARDEAGNEAASRFVDRVFPKSFRRSRIEVDDRFLERVVPEILAHTPELGPEAEATELVPAFLQINGDLRRLNAERITALTTASSPGRLWQGPFVQLGNSQVEAGFADQRTYTYEGKEIDRQVHLGFDLAATAAVPVMAANAGRVVHAAWLGIYGNCVIIDHGMGVASLYGHLSAIDVGVNDMVSRGQPIGRSGMTGLAGGDHLHFTMLVHGRPVNPVEWWDRQWVEDRVDRKLRDAGR